MTVITKEHIDHHCKTLSISREELTDFTIPDGVTEIDQEALKECISLECITIPHGVTKIGISAFYKCTSLTFITIPDGITEIGINAFGRCTSLHPSPCLMVSLRLVGAFS